LWSEVVGLEQEEMMAQGAAVGLAVSAQELVLP
jgi:hypothetical protein